jgi:hypothetical protein
VPSPREILRLKYRPAKVRILFVGESPPHSGRFFYERNSGLYRAVRDAFRVVDPTLGDENFLAAFRDAGCYLIDLCRTPVDHLDRKSRERICVRYEASLGRQIEALAPETIVTVVRSIRGNVDTAILRIGWNGDVVDLPYPGRWVRNRKEFIRLLVRELRRRAHHPTMPGPVLETKSRRL